MIANYKRLKLKKCFHQERLEALHLPEMQAGDDWKSDRHGRFLEVHQVFQICSLWDLHVMENTNCSFSVQKPPGKAMMAYHQDEKSCALQCSAVKNIEKY